MASFLVLPWPVQLPLTHRDRAGHPFMDDHSLILVTLPKFILCDFLWTIFLFPFLEFSINDYFRNCQEKYFHGLVVMVVHLILFTSAKWIKGRVLSYPSHWSGGSGLFNLEKNHTYLQVFLEQGVFSRQWEKVSGLQILVKSKVKEMSIKYISLFSILYMPASLCCTSFF